MNVNTKLVSVNTKGCNTDRHLEKQKKELNINRFSSRFQQNHRNISGHLITDDLENVGQGKNLQKCTFLNREYF